MSGAPDKQRDVVILSSGEANFLGCIYVVLAGVGRVWLSWRCHFSGCVPINNKGYHFSATVPAPGAILVVAVFTK